MQVHSCEKISCLGDLLWIRVGTKKGPKSSGGKSRQFPEEERPGAESPSMSRGQPSVRDEGRAEGTANGRT